MDFRKYIEKLFKEWKDFTFKFDDSESRLLARTEKALLEAFGVDHDFIQAFNKIRSEFYMVDVHPLESYNEEEYEKWDIAKKKMLELLKNALESFT